MKPKQLLILVAVLAVLGLVAFIAGRSGGGDRPNTAELRGKSVLDGWDINDVSGVEVKSGSGTVGLKKSDTNWTVAERGDFPADRAKVENMLRRVWTTPVMQAFEAGNSQDERMELIEPDGEGEKEDNTATKLTFRGKDGSDIGHVLIGKSKSPDAGPAADPMGGSGGKTSRYLRTSRDSALVLEVNNGFAEDLAGTGWPYAFGSIEADPGLWLNKEDFIKVQKIQSVAVNYKEGDNEAYTLTRESDTGDFKLEGDVPAGKVLDSSKVSGLKTIFSNASFDDLLTAEQESAIDQSKLTEATIKTFDGLTYTFLIGKKDDDKDRFPIKFTITGELATERVVESGKEETEEEKTKADAEFQTKLKEAQDKLAKEKALESHWFTLSAFRVDPLLKSRPDLIKDEEVAKEEEAPPASIALPPGDQLPPGLGAGASAVEKKPTVEAVSAPVAVPPLTKGATATTPPIEIPRPTTPPAESAAEVVKEAVDEVKGAVDEVKEAVDEVKEAASDAVEAVQEAAKPAAEGGE